MCYYDQACLANQLLTYAVCRGPQHDSHYVQCPRQSDAPFSPQSLHFKYNFAIQLYMSN